LGRQLAVAGCAVLFAEWQGDVVPDDADCGAVSEPPHMLFPNGPQAVESNRLVVQVQPAEGIQLHFETKVPDAG
jgi:hypothetical protein